MKKIIKDVVITVGTWSLSIYGLDAISTFNSESEKNGNYFVDNNYEVDYYKDTPINELLNKQVTNWNHDSVKGSISEEEQIQQLLSEREEYENHKKLNEIKYQENLKKQRELERQAELDKQAELKKIEDAKKAEAVKQQSVHTTKNNTYESDWMTFEATYYSAFCDTCGGQGLTASGVSVANSIYYKGMRVIATNQNEIPMYSIVEIKAHYGTFKAVALDTGGFGKGGVDILVDSDKTARNLGRHNVQIRIIGKIN